MKDIFVTIANDSVIKSLVERNKKATKLEKKEKKRVVRKTIYRNAKVVETTVEPVVEAPIVIEPVVEAPIVETVEEEIIVDEAPSFVVPIEEEPEEEV